jgi:hypothetical protein
MNKMKRTMLTCTSISELDGISQIGCGRGATLFPSSVIPDELGVDVDAWKVFIESVLYDHKLLN